MVTEITMMSTITYFLHCSQMLVAQQEGALFLVWIQVSSTIVITVIYCLHSPPKSREILTNICIL